MLIFRIGSLKNGGAPSLNTFFKKKLCGFYSFRNKVNIRKKDKHHERTIIWGNNLLESIELQ